MSVRPLMDTPRDVVIVGGVRARRAPARARTGQPGLSVVVYDIDEHAVESVNGGVVPFKEPGAPEVLARVLESGQLRARRARGHLDRRERDRRDRDPGGRAPQP